MKTQTPPVPELGTIGWLVLDPQAGREQAEAGRRPAIVLSHTRYNEKIGLAVFCPITSKVKG
jgi:mRNA interferase MazF